MGMPGHPAVKMTPSSKSAVSIITDYNPDMIYLEITQKRNEIENH